MSSLKITKIKENKKTLKNLGESYQKLLDSFCKKDMLLKERWKEKEIQIKRNSWTLSKKLLNLLQILCMVVLDMLIQDFMLNI